MELKRMSFLGVLFCVMTLGLSLVSCSDDDDKAQEVQVGLVGKWEYAYEDVTSEYIYKNISTYVFNADNTGSYTETESLKATAGSTSSDYTTVDTENFTYIYDASKDRLILNFVDRGFYRQYSVMGISSRELMLQDSEGGVWIYFRK